MNINIDTFNKWAAVDRDISMENGHRRSVLDMFNILEKERKLENDFSFLDIGCGNGWVIRDVLKNKNCFYALGIDGAPNMIQKAKKFNLGDFELTDIEKYNLSRTFDIIFSMETFYYFKQIDKLLNNIYNNGLNENGIIIIGIDHYKENKESLSWGEDYNLDLTTLSIKEWVSLFNNANFKKVSHEISKQDNSSHGTLIIYGYK